jgi:hypothetical protein
MNWNLDPRVSLTIKGVFRLNSLGFLMIKRKFGKKSMIQKKRRLIFILKKLLEQLIRISNSMRHLIKRMQLIP